MIRKEGKKFNSEDEYQREIEDRSRENIKKSLELVQLFDRINDDEKAQLTILVDKLSHGGLTEKADIDINIGRKKIPIKDYIEEVLPQVDFNDANERVIDILKEKNKI